jgi:CO dehydrogenase flavoprotein C-terminal domain
MTAARPQPAPPGAPAPPGPGPTSHLPVTLRVNGATHDLVLEPRHTLLNALFDAGPCHAVHPSDLATALHALDATVPWRAREAEDLLHGADVDAAETLFERAAAAAQEGATPLAHNAYNAYKVPIAHTLVRRALAALATA